MLEGYITPLLMSYIDKYIKNIKPSDLQVSFWGGDAVLRNLELRLDVLEQVLDGFPLEIKSGHIRELSIHLPWNAIASSSVEITIQDLELVVKMKSMRSKARKKKSESFETVDSDSSVPIKKSPSSVSLGGSIADQQPGYLQGYLNRIINNGQVHIQRMVVKVIEEECDLMLTMNIGSVEMYTTDESWEKKFVYTDYFKENFALHKVCDVEDMTVNLHSIEGIGQTPNTTTSHEPFIQRCGFTGRMKLDYRGNMFVKKSVDVLFDSVQFQSDENQFCLWIHFMDWILAAYYSTLRLKGRDGSDQDKANVDPDSCPAPLGEVTRVHHSQSLPAMTSADKTPLVDTTSSRHASEADIKPETSKSTESNESVGWGSWMYSFIATSETETGDNQEGSNSSDKAQRSIEPSSTLSMSAKSVSVTLKVTHKVQVPIFYSMRSFSTPVVHVHFTGCTAKVDTVPQTKLFLFTLGIMSVEASVTGLCPCVKKFPSSWRRTSTSNISETTEEIPVFSMGTQQSTNPKSTGVSDDLLTGTLFAPSSSASLTIDLPPATKEGLAQIGKPYKAVWISYLYFNVDQSRPVEECTETISIGRTKMAVGPDVVHRLQHFLTAFKQSNEANPASSKGKVVLGEPKAESVVNIDFAGGHILVTPNAHYIPTSNPDLSSKTHKHQSPKRARKLQLSPSLPSLCISCEVLDISLSKPMYSGNASEECPQKVQIRAQQEQIEVGIVTVKSLSDALKDRSSVVTERATGSSVKQLKSSLQFDKCFCMPKVELNYHSKTSGDVASGSSYLGVDVESITCIGSLEQISHSLFVAGSWLQNAPRSSLAELKVHTSVPQSLKVSPALNHKLHAIFKTVALTRSTSERYSSISAILGEASVSVLKCKEQGTVDRCIHIFHGPLSTSEWNTVDCYRQEGSQNRDHNKGLEKFVQFFMATPVDSVKEELFPAIQMEVAGCAMSLDPCLVSLLKLLPLDSFNIAKQSPSDQNLLRGFTTESSSLIGPPLPSPSPSLFTPHTLTGAPPPSPSFTPHTVTDAPSEEDDLVSGADSWSFLKMYEIKVKVSPVLIILPTQESALVLSDHTHPSTTGLPDFPLLSHLAGQVCEGPSSTADSAIFVSLPSVLLESVKGHVLDEPVKKDSRVDTLPWDCTLAQFSVFTLVGGQARYILEPLTVKVTLAPQQEGSGVTIHTDNVTMSLSKKQVLLISTTLREISKLATTLTQNVLALTNEPKDRERNLLDSPPETPSLVDEKAPSHLSSPAPSTLTRSNTFPGGSDVSTVSSLAYQGFSSLWIQVLLPKLTLDLYVREQSTRSVGGDGNESDMQPQVIVDDDRVIINMDQDEVGTDNISDSPSSQSDVCKGVISGISRDSQVTRRETPLRLSFEAEGLSLQVDIQEKCADIVFKVAAMDSTMSRKEMHRYTTPPPGTNVMDDSYVVVPSNLWMPCISNSNGKLFSSSCSVLPESLSQLIPPPASSLSLVPSQQLYTGQDLPGHHSPKRQSNFVLVKVIAPRNQIHKAVKVSCSVYPFEAVAWLPALQVVLDIVYPSLKGESAQESKTDSKRSSSTLDLSLWPSLEVQLECFRIVMPNSDFTNALLLSAGGLQITSTLDYSSTDVRFVTNSSAFRKLSRLSIDKHQPPLPIYQLDMFAVSVWGLCRNGSVQSFLCASTADVRVVYTPPLSLSPPTPWQQRSLVLSSTGVLATGHCLEANVTTDVTLFFGIEQLKCALEIFKSNSLRHPHLRDPKAPADSVARDSISSPDSSPSEKGLVPFKVLLIGRTVAVSFNASKDHMTSHDHLNDLTSSYEDVQSDSCNGAVTPILHVLLYNPLLTIQMDQECSKSEMSCFNMAALYSHQLTSVSYTDLTATESMTSLLGSKLLETRRGLSSHKTGLPPNLLTLSWSQTGHDIESASEAGVVSIDVGRPVKLSLTPSLLREGVCFLSDLADIVVPLVSRSLSSLENTETNQSCYESRDTSSVYFTPQKSDIEDSNISEKSNSKASCSTNNTAMVTEVSLSTCQVVMELSLKAMSVEQPTHLEHNPNSAFYTKTEEANTSLLEESFTNASSPCNMMEEGLVASWEDLSLTIPPKDDHGQSGDLHINGLQLLSVCQGVSGYVVPPVQLECILRHHLPLSTHDLPQTAVQVRCGLLEVFLSQPSLSTLIKATSTLSNSLQTASLSFLKSKSSLDTEAVQSNERVTASRNVTLGGADHLEGAGSRLDDPVSFKDDLRTGEFRYVMDESAVPRMPNVGEILFHLGDDSEVSPTMTWEYKEPRALTKITVLPVPFSITSEHDTPVNVKVKCSLQYWQEEEASFASLDTFYVSETDTAELLLPAAHSSLTPSLHSSEVFGHPLMSCRCSSRVWRVAVIQVEWADEDEGEVFVSQADILDPSGAVLPLSSVLSPVSLAASLRVNSVFSPCFVPAYTFKFHCSEFHATLLHSLSDKSVDKKVLFDGFRTVPSFGKEGQELLRMSVKDGAMVMKQKRNRSTSIKMDGLLSMEYVDFGDMVWRTAVHPTKLTGKFEYRQDVKTNSLGSTVAVDSKVASLSINLKSSPSVLRISQGFVHTSILAAQVWLNSLSSRNANQDDCNDIQGPGVCTLDPVSLLLNHYILCNDTLEDLHIGQVSTDEDTLLCSGTCAGYSWRSHKTELRQLKLCLVTRGSWRWTKPFSVDSPGVFVVELPTRNLTATVSVRVTELGGLQKQVTFFGGWKFFSTLPFPVEVQLTPLHFSDSDTDYKHTDGLVNSPSPPSKSIWPILTLPANDSLPSILGSEDELGGVKIRAAGAKDWSKVYPLSNRVQEWNRPQLLAEFHDDSGAVLHCWYNMKSMDSTVKKPWGSKISLSPLFAVANHLPFELTMTMDDSQPLPSLPNPDPTPEASSLPKTKTVVKLASGGETLPLHSLLSADTWYHGRFEKNGVADLSDPPLALSTDLLHHLPFSDSGTDSSPSSTTFLTLPLEDDTQCSVQATFVRNHLNTITVVLRPEATVANHTPFELQVVEVFTGDDLDKEKKWEGKVLVEEKREKTTTLAPSEIGVLTQKEFVVSVDWNGNPFFSNPITLASLTESQRSKDSQGADETTITSLYLTEVVGGPMNECDRDDKVSAELLLLSESTSKSLITTVKPSYILHNNTELTLSVRPSIFPGKVNQSLLSKAHRCKKDNHRTVFLVEPGEAKPVIFWHNVNSKRREPGESSSLTQALCLRATEDKASSPPSWSIFLSPKFVRHSFSLPTCDEDNTYTPCLLTRHESYGTTYLVVTKDPSPRLYIQNLCATDLEIIEYGTKGLNAFPQQIPSGCEAIYEPPSVAKVYPLVFDEEVMSDQEKEMKMKATRTMLQLCQRANEEGSKGLKSTPWSEPFLLSSDEDKVISIPELGGVLVSTDQRGHAIYASIIPTGSVLLIPGNQKALANVTAPNSLTSVGIEFKLEQLIICIDDEVSNRSAVCELLRLYGDDIEVSCSPSIQGVKLEMSMQSCRIDNMHEQSLSEYAVAMTPRCEHARRPSLLQTGSVPVANLCVHFNPRSTNCIDLLKISTQPVTIQIEDSLIQHMKELVHTFLPPGVLVASSTREGTTSDSNVSESSYTVTPNVILKESERDAIPLAIANLVIEPASFYLNASITVKVFLSCNDTPFQFGQYKLENVYSNWSEVLQIVGARYVSSALMHAGWVLGSLELLGSPGTLIHCVGRGLRDLVSLPYEGIRRSPGMFILGLGQGTASFIRNCSTGALSSVTSLASSISKNMENLSMDPNHASYQDLMRRQTPTTRFSSGITSGVSSFGLSLISAVAGIVDQPMQSFQRIDEDSTTLGATGSILAGVGKGLLGVVTKPMGGAMELVSKTGQGIMQGTGLARNLTHREISESLKSFVGPILKCELHATVLKCARKLDREHPYIAAIFATRANQTTSETQHFVILLTSDKLYFLDCESDIIQQNIPIRETNLVECSSSLLDGQVELHVQQSTKDEQAKAGPPEFQAVEYYLDLPQRRLNLEEPDEVSVTDLDQSRGAEGNRDNDSEDQDLLESKSSDLLNVTYLVEGHHSVQFQSLYQSVRQYLCDPDSTFPVNGAISTSNKTIHNDLSFFSAISQVSPSQNQ